MPDESSIVARRQAPLRKLYRSEPERAVIVKRVYTSHRPGGDPLRGVVTPGPYGVSVVFGNDRAVGGYHDAPNAGELLCAAVAACEDATMRMTADVLGVRIEELSVEVIGVVDVRGAMSVDRSAPVGFDKITCKVRLRVAPGSDERKVKLLIAEAERSCINIQTLRDGVPVEMEVDLGGS